MRIVVLSNDVVPGMGLPVAAPGLRAWGIALGLRAHGHDVRVIVDERVARIAWKERESGLPPASPRGVLLAPPREVTRYVRTHDVEALVVTNSNHVDVLGDLGQCRLVYDFFAPKMLELAEQAPPERREEQLARLETRKLGALRRSDLVIVNGAKKLPYVAEWVARAGRPDLPTAVVNMPLPPVDPAPIDDGRVHAVVSGYIQPWSRLGSWITAMRPFLDDGSMVLHLMMATHWGQTTTEGLPRALVELADRGSAVRHGPMGFADFRTLMSRCHLNVDVFKRNPERELAMVTRSATALSCGVPTMHVPFTEVSEFIREYDAGWLVEEEDIEAMTAVFRSALDAGELARRREGAVRVAREVLEPTTATQPLADLLAGPLEGAA